MRTVLQQPLGTLLSVLRFGAKICSRADKLSSLGENESVIIIIFSIRIGISGINGNIVVVIE